MKIYKPKFWDLRDRTYLSYLLSPFTLPLIINNHFLSSAKKKIKTLKQFAWATFMLVVQAKHH